MADESAKPVTLRMAETTFRQDITLDKLRHDMAVFVAEREWEKFHTPRNILLALAGEVGELCEIFQWRGDEGSPHYLPTWNEKDKTHLGEELSDVLLYLLRLSDICGVDLPAAAIRKMELNRRKYPADKARGRSDKYTAYMEDKAAASAGGASTHGQEGSGADVSHTGSSVAHAHTSSGGSAGAGSASGSAAGDKEEGTSTPVATPRKGTPAEARTPKESPTNPVRFSLTNVGTASLPASAQGSDAGAAEGGRRLFEGSNDHTTAHTTGLAGKAWDALAVVADIAVIASAVALVTIAVNRL